MQQSRGAPRQISVTKLATMRALGVYPTPSAAGPGHGVGEPLGRSPSSPPTKTHQPQTLGKRSRKQLDPRQDPAAADHLPCSERDEDLPSGALTPTAGLGRMRLPPGSYRDMDEEEEEKEEEVEVIGQGHRDLSSRLKGVSWDKRNNKWVASGRDQGKKVHIGYYDNEEDAARACQDYVEHGTLPARKAPTSAFRGVSWQKSKKSWRTEIKERGQSTHLGYFQTQQEAALAYNAAVTRLGYPASWLNDISHTRSADGDEHNDKDVPAGKKAVVTVYAKPPRRRPPADTSNAPPPVAVEGRAAQHLTPYELQGKANLTHNIARMVAPGAAGLAQNAGLPPEHSPSPRPRPHPMPAAAMTSTSESAHAEAFNIGAPSGEDSREEALTPAASPGVATLEEAAMEARIEALEAKGQAAIAQASVKFVEADAKAALAEARAALAEKRLSAHSTAAPRAH